MNQKTNQHHWSLVLMLVSSLLISNVSQAAGLLTPKDGSLPALEIKDHNVNVIIEDGYAITTVEQVFHNPHGSDLEATYSFPVPEQASVGEFTMWIDGKPVTGEVLEKKEARKVYEEEKAAGRDAGITEKDGYKTFDISVAPVRAGKDTRIRLTYIQPAHVDTGIGRYVYPLEEGGVDEQKLAFWTSNEKVTNSFSFNLKVKSVYPVDAVRVPNQGQANVKQHGDGEWTVHMGSKKGSAKLVQPMHQDVSKNISKASLSDVVTMAANTGSNAAPQTAVDMEAGTSKSPNTPAFNPQQNGAVYTLDKDLVVYWRLKPGLPGSVDLVTHKPNGAKRGTFMMVVTPGDDLKPITEGKDWVFVLDISGSMKGKYATLSDGVQRALKKMSSTDRFRIILFNNAARELTSGYVNATPQNVSLYSKKVASITPNNGTNMYAGISQGLAALDADRTSGIVLVTDGVANVGETQQRKFIELIRKKDARLFTLVMGNSANRPLLEALTRVSSGFAVNISNSDDIVGRLLEATSKVNHEALHGVKVEISGVKTDDLTPPEIGSLYRGQQLVLFGHYWGDGMADVRIKGKVSGQTKEYRTQFAFPKTSNENPEIERLWAYASIEDMMAEMEDFGEKADIKQAVTDLGREYGLVTDYTSMLVLRDDIFAKRGIKRLNKARLATEHAAQQQRATRPAQQRRVDTRQPMYKSKRPSFSGGGALDAWSVLMLLPLVWLIIGRRQRIEA